ncbi:MAG: NADP-dependent oxidoreductase [Chloroflexota bacterium]
MPNNSRPNRQILMIERPSGHLEERHFQAKDGTIGEPASGEVLVRTILLSIDPANRAWMRGRTYRDQLNEGEVMAGFTLGEVVVENGSGIPAGTIVTCESGWQEYAIHPANRVNRVEIKGPLTHHMSVMGVTGLTAYFGLLEIGAPRSGETVAVSAAAGATGNVVGQIARILGCRVVGIAGSDDKNEMLVRDLGFDAAVNYKSDSLREELRTACPKGIDVYFDNVGGPLLDAVLPVMRPHGRVACCGSVSQYDVEGQPVGARLVPGILVVSRIRMEGFLVGDFYDKWPGAEKQLAAWIASGELKVLEEVLDGLDTAPGALIGLLAGKNTGKRMVRVGPDAA